MGGANSAMPTLVRNPRRDLPQFLTAARLIVILPILHLPRAAYEAVILHKRACQDVGRKRVHHKEVG
jgi:hypothetical protein